MQKILVMMAVGVATLAMAPAPESHWRNGYRAGGGVVVVRPFPRFHYGWGYPYWGGYYGGYYGYPYAYGYYPPVVYNAPPPAVYCPPPAAPPPPRPAPGGLCPAPARARAGRPRARHSARGDLPARQVRARGGRDEHGLSLDVDSDPRLGTDAGGAGEPRV